jgi:topoisomerase-4 subunit B
VKTIREFYNKTLSLRIFVNPVSAVSIKVMEPVLNLKQKQLGSTDMGSEAGMPSVRTFVNDFIKIN